MALSELLHQINPSGQKGVWAHSQNVEADLLKRYVVDVKRTGWLAMGSFDSVAGAQAYAASGAIQAQYPGQDLTLRIMDDRMQQLVG